MKTVHAARPHYPTYRHSAHLTARHPVIEFVLGGVLCGFLFVALFALVKIIFEVLA